MFTFEFVSGKSGPRIKSQHQHLPTPNTMKTAAPTKLLQSALIQRAAPRVQSILSSYSQNPLQQDDDAFCPYFRGISSKEPASTVNTPQSNARPLISAHELSEWQTPYMPLLTSRQLELTLLEIRRRQRHYRRKVAVASDTVDTNANETKTKREAAIFVPLCTVNNVPSILFTRRSGSLSTHASQVRFVCSFKDHNGSC